MATNIFSVLITGANRGLGYEFVRQLANGENPPKFIFAACRGKSDDLQRLAEAAPKNTKIQIVQLGNVMILFRCVNTTIVHHIRFFIVCHKMSEMYI